MSAPIAVAPTVQREYLLRGGVCDEVLLQLRGVSARARALGCGPIDVTVHEQVQPVRLHVRCVAPTLGRWRLLARVAHNAGPPNEIIAVGDTDPATLTRWRDGPPRCDHCGVARRRRDTYLLDGPAGIVQIGSGCVTAYTQAGDIEAALRHGDYLHELHDILLRAGAAPVRDTPAADATPPMTVGSLRLLSFCVHAAVRDGWTARRDSHPQRPATVDTALRAITAAADGAPVDGHAPAGSDWARAAAILTWTRSALRGQDPYRRRVALVAAREQVTEHEAPLLAAALAGWAREHDLQGASRPVGRERLTDGLWVTVQYVGRGRDGRRIVTLRDRFANRISVALTADRPVVGSTWRLHAEDVEYRLLGRERATVVHGAQLHPWTPPG